MDPLAYFEERCQRTREQDLPCCYQRFLFNDFYVGDDDPPDYGLFIRRFAAEVPASIILVAIRSMDERQFAVASALLLFLSTSRENE
ncbi:MAG: hypothetical protein AAF191_21110, partial [Verrucomicrobiota bacterium]